MATLTVKQYVTAAVPVEDLFSRFTKQIGGYNDASTTHIVVHRDSGDNSDSTGTLSRVTADTAEGYDNLAYCEVTGVTISNDDGSNTVELNDLLADTQIQFDVMSSYSGGGIINVDYPYIDYNTVTLVVDPSLDANVEVVALLHSGINTEATAIQDVRVYQVSGTNEYILSYTTTDTTDTSTTLSDIDEIKNHIKAKLDEIGGSGDVNNDVETRNSFVNGIYTEYAGLDTENIIRKFTLSDNSNYIPDGSTYHVVLVRTG